MIEQIVRTEPSRVVVRSHGKDHYCAVTKVEAYFRVGQPHDVSRRRDIRNACVSETTEALEHHSYKRIAATRD